MDGRNDFYSRLADLYASYQAQINAANAYNYDSMLMLVANDSNFAKVDCLNGFVQTHEDFGSPTLSVLTAVKTLNVFVLKRNKLADINDYLSLREIKVRPEWAFLSELTGYVIREEFIGYYGDSSS